MKNALDAWAFRAYIAKSIIAGRRAVFTTKQMPVHWPLAHAVNSCRANVNAINTRVGYHGEFWADCCSDMLVRRSCV